MNCYNAKPTFKPLNIKLILVFMFVFACFKANATLIYADTFSEVSDLSSTDEVVLKVDDSGPFLKLLGAYNVKIFGLNYDMRFVDGVIGELFQDSSHFILGGTLGIEAFEEQVLHRFGVFENEFNSRPERVLGCEGYLIGIDDYCKILFPFLYSEANDGYFSRSFKNSFLSNDDEIDFISESSSASYDSSLDGTVTLTQWSFSLTGEFRQPDISSPPGTPIPEPASLLLFLVSIVMLMSLSKKRLLTCSA